MNRAKRARKTFLPMCLSLIITFAFLIHVNFLRAEEIERIGPNQTFDFVLLLEGQTATLNTSQPAPIGAHTVGVVSIGNPTMSAELRSISSDATGMWWIMLMGTGGKDWADFAYGIVPFAGEAAKIDINQGVSYGFATGGLILTSPPPASYSIKIN